MKEYKLGEQARFVGKCHKRFSGKVCVIVGVGGFMTKDNRIRKYAIDFLDPSLKPQTSPGYACDGDALEPLQKPKLGSWEELYEAGWNPTGLEVEHVYANKQEKSSNE